MPKITVHIEANLIWKWCRTTHGKYVGICDAIAQTVQADKFGDLLETMNEVLDSTFRELLSTGDLNKFLHEHGWNIRGRPVSKRDVNIRFDVPFGLKQFKNSDPEKVLC